MSKRFIGLLAAVAVSVACWGLIGTAALGAGGWRTFGGGYAQGRIPFVAVSAEVANPNALRFRVLDNKQRRIRVSWTLMCQRGARTASRSGTVARKAPFARTLRLTVRNPDTCNLYASGSQAGFRGGAHRLAVILQRR